jgi:hypothetical protein
MLILTPSLLPLGFLILQRLFFIITFLAQWGSFTVFGHDFKLLILVRLPNDSRSSEGNTTGTIVHIIQRHGKAGRVLEGVDKVVVFCDMYPVMIATDRKAEVLTKVQLGLRNANKTGAAATLPKIYFLK